MTNLSNHQVYLSHETELARIKKQFREGKITLAQAQVMIDAYYEKHKDILGNRFQVDKDFKIKTEDDQC